MVRLVLSVFLLFLSCAVPAACDRPLRVLAQDWSPYIEIVAGEPVVEVSGLDADVLRAVAREAGCALVWVPMPVDRARPALRTGQLDLMLAASRIPEREAYAHFSLPYREEVIIVAGRLGVAPLSDWDQLLHEQRLMVAPRSGWYGKEYERYRGALIDAGLLLFMGDYSAGSAMLKAGRVDLIMGDQWALESAAREVEMVLSRPLMEVARDPVHFMYSRATVDVATVQRLDQVLARWQQDGTLDRLRRGYLP